MQLLIAHKQAAVRAALARAIAGSGDADLELVECGAGVEALQMLLREDSPPLAVVDWDLPGLDGPELCRLVHDFHLGKPPYLVLLAASSHADIAPVLEAGANDCIRTPALAAEIREQVDAGRLVVRAAKEPAGRGGMLEAVRSRDMYEESWNLSPSADELAGAGGQSRRKFDLQAVLTAQ